MPGSAPGRGRDQGVYVMRPSLGGRPMRPVSPGADEAGQGEGVLVGIGPMASVPGRGRGRGQRVLVVPSLGVTTATFGPPGLSGVYGGGVLGLGPAMRGPGGSPWDFLLGGSGGLGGRGGFGVPPGLLGSTAPNVVMLGDRPPIGLGGRPFKPARRPDSLDGHPDKPAAPEDESEDEPEDKPEDEPEDKPVDELTPHSPKDVPKRMKPTNSKHDQAAPNDDVPKDVPKDGPASDKPPHDARPEDDDGDDDPEDKLDITTQESEDTTPPTTPAGPTDAPEEAPEEATPGPEAEATTPTPECDGGACPLPPKSKPKPKRLTAA